MKKILGLDLGTNSIGWALVNEGGEGEKSEIVGMGSRIIPRLLKKHETSQPKLLK